MDHLNGWQRLWVVLGVLAGLYVMYSQADTWLSPRKTLNTVYQYDMDRLNENLAKVKADSVEGSEQAVKAFQTAIVDRQITFAKQAGSLVVVAFSVFIVVVFQAAVTGCGVFLIGFALEWIFKGFRPKRDVAS